MTKQYTEHLELILNESDDTVPFKPDYQATLQKIDAYAVEVDDALEGIGTNAQSIASEAQARTAADLLLQQNVDTEAINRSMQDQALAALVSALTASLSNEVTARGSADVGLQASIDQLVAVTNASKPGSDAWILANANLDLLIYGTVTRDSNLAATASYVRWPDGTYGVYNATSVSTAFPGAVDAYTISYTSLSAGTKIYTQPAVTRDSTGAVINRPLPLITVTTTPSGIYTAVYGATY